ncbi:MULTISPECIES: hypothetical protein [Nostoc]|uniref:Uncharacterized protein n=1 Tax=Nostoc paludosum FACHB-159 TaxID=2692908 RepID=A0ABR8K8T6_9NOSO|nr:MULTISPECIES: hypothetical protein [Nostoc]MBD2678516.1 hypothetical protein [Nostoc sp. FACHB-857]MBD2734562.1 hypothetical protein [Nostoc paludosum FACHB-159]
METQKESQTFPNDDENLWKHHRSTSVRNTTLAEDDWKVLPWKTQSVSILHK